MIEFFKELTLMIECFKELTLMIQCFKESETEVEKCSKEEEEEEVETTSGKEPVGGSTNFTWNGRFCSLIEFWFFSRVLVPFTSSCDLREEQCQQEPQVDEKNTHFLWKDMRVSHTFSSIITNFFLLEFFPSRVLSFLWFFPS